MMELSHPLTIIHCQLTVMILFMVVHVAVIIMIAYGMSHVFSG